MLVVQLLDDLKNVLDALHLRLEILYIFRYEFQRNVPFSDQIARLPKRPHPPASNRLKQLVISTKNRSRCNQRVVIFVVSGAEGAFLSAGIPIRHFSLLNVRK